MSQAKKISTMGVFPELISMRELMECTQVPKRTVRHYIYLGLVSKPLGTKATAAYNYLHVIQIRRVQEMIKKGWQPAELAELGKRPLYWQKTYSTYVNQNTVGKQRLNKSAVSITESIHIEWNGARSPLVNRLVRVMVKAGREELKRQKDVAKTLRLP